MCILTLRTVLIAFIGLGAVSLSQPLCSSELQPQHPRRHAHGEGMAAMINATAHVPTGKEDDAIAYYKNIVVKEMKFESEATIEQSTIKNLLDYFGYPAINARDLHLLSSDSLMALGDPDDILATRFFAPKITRVETPPVAVPRGGFGWRKLVRFTAQPGSKADLNGMDALYVLQNIFEPTASGNPFAAKNVSLFNQAIATRKPGTWTSSSGMQAAYFFAYEPLVKCKTVSTVCKAAGDLPLNIGGQLQDDGRIAFALKATFDARNPETETSGKDLYYVPRSCAACHGGISGPVKLNFLDTDHWHDRVAPAYGLTDIKFSQEDFTALSGDEHPVLYDRKIDKALAFEVIRKLNLKIKVQNEDVKGTPFQLAAVTKWLEIHDPAGADPTRHVPPYLRGFGSQTWEANNNDHRATLYYLNRYCYRCHSSIKYNVFDRSEVRRLRDGIDGIIDRVLQFEKRKWMPQDRMFPGLEEQSGIAQATGDLKQFIDLLKQLP